MVKSFDFTAVAQELRLEEERKRLEREATKLLRRKGLDRNGRCSKERSGCVLLVCNNNGPRR